MVLLLLIPLLLIGALYYGYRLAFYYRDPHNGPRLQVMDDQTEKVAPHLNQAIDIWEAAPYEPVSILSHDGLKLTGRYYHIKDNAPLQIQFHGYKGDAIRDFCGVWPSAKQLGHNVLLVDQRCHGGSEGHTITFGVKEHKDCFSWVAYACHRFGSVPMILMGVSMGAATVLMASGLNLPENVKGIVADCPYDAPDNIIKKVLSVEMGLPVKLMYPLIRMSGRLFGGFDLESCPALEAVTRSKVPILLIHGEEDRFVPPSMSRNLKAAAPGIIEFHSIPDAGHALNQVTAPETYHRILADFLEAHIS